MTFERAAIEETLPHRHPFLFLDEAVLEEGKATGAYNVTGEEFFFPGHFKEEPVFPASLMMEGLGQLGAFFLLKYAGPELEKEVDNRRILFASSERTSCHNIARPGDRLEYSVSFYKLRHPFIKFHGKILVNGKKIASVEEMTLAFDYKKG